MTGPEQDQRWNTGAAADPNPTEGSGVGVGTVPEHQSSGTTTLEAVLVQERPV